MKEFLALWRSTKAWPWGFRLLAVIAVCARLLATE